MTAARDIGVQSYCFRQFKDNRQVIELTRQIGVDRVEICSVHANFDDLEAFKGIVDLYGNAGIKIISLGVQRFVGDVSRERKWFACARAAGARHISGHFTVSTFATAIPAVAAMCDEFGVRVGIHCHGGYNFGGSPDVLEHLLQLGGKNIGLNLDTAWCMQIGPSVGDPVQWIRERFRGRIYGVHYKDFVFDRRGQWKDVIIGTGNLDLPGVVAALEETGFDGMAVVEYEADPQNPVPALSQCVKRIRDLTSSSG